MAKRGVKKRDYEKLDDSTIARVVSLLEQEKPITKKVACEILNISYNTSRLNSIIEEYKAKVEHTKKRLKMNRGKPYTDLELKEVIIGYLSGESITSIAKSLFRSVNSVKLKINELHLPERNANSTYHNPELMPDEMISDSFEPGELVWANRYNSVAEIRKNYGNTKDYSIYSIYVFGKHEQFAIQPSFELGKLKVLQELNLNYSQFQTNEKPNFNYRID